MNEAIDALKRILYRYTISERLIIAGVFLLVLSFPLVILMTQQQTQVKQEASTVAACTCTKGKCWAPGSQCGNNGIGRCETNCSNAGSGWTGTMCNDPSCRSTMCCYPPSSGSCTSTNNWPDGSSCGGNAGKCESNCSNAGPGWTGSKCNDRSCKSTMCCQPPSGGGVNVGPCAGLTTSQSACMKNGSCPTKMSSVYVNKPGDNNNGACGRGTTTDTYTCCVNNNLITPTGAGTPTDTPGPTLPGGATPPDTPGPTLPVGDTPTDTPTPILSQSATPTDTPTPTVSSSGGDEIFTITVCPHGLGNCGDNVSANSGGNTNPQHPTRNVTVTLLDSTGAQVIQKQGNVQYNSSSQNFQGTVDMGVVNSGLYLVKVKTDGFLSATIPGFQQITTGGTISLPAISEVTGDITNDDQLDIQDYNALIGCFGSKSTTASCTFPITQTSPGADINDDGKIDGIDYNLFIRELSVQKGI